MNYWLIKSEPTSYSIDDLQKDGSTAWDGVRNYQARNYMRDQMQVGDKALFYHSSSDQKGVVGIAEVTRSAYPDESAFDPNDSHFDSKSDRDNPTWMLVDFSYRETFARTVSLAEIKQDPRLEGIMVAKTGSRLSIQPVSERHFKIITYLGRTHNQ